MDKLKKLTTYYLFALSFIVIFGFFAFSKTPTIVDENNISARVGGSWNIVDDLYVETASESGWDVLINGINKYLNFNAISGSLGYGFRDNAGTMEYKSSGGSWAQFSAGGGLSATAFSATSPLTLATTSSTALYGMTQASSTADGYLSSTDWSTFNNKLSTTLTDGYLFVGDGSNVAQASSEIFIDGTSQIGINDITPSYRLDVNGTGRFVDALNIDGGLKDTDVTTAIKLGDASSTSFNTTNKTIVGALNEVRARQPYIYSGFTSIGTTTDNGDGTLTIADADVSLFDNPNNEGRPSNYTLTGGTTGTDFAAISTGTVNYLVGDYNGGSPVFKVITNLELITWSDVEPYITLNRENGVIHGLSWDEAGEGLANKLEMRTIKTNRFEREEGLAIGESVGRIVTITSGRAWNGVQRLSLDSFSSDTGSWHFYYNVSGTMTLSTTTTQYNNTQYDNGTDLVTLGPSKFAINWVYRCQDEEPHGYYVLANESYSTLAAAQLAQPRSDLPSIIKNNTFLVGRIIVVKDAVTSSAVESSFDLLFAPTIPANHNDLSNIQGGVAGENYHLDSSDYTELTVWLGGVTLGATTITGLTSITSTSFVGALTGNADTATALAANGANCSAGNYPLGVDASGAVESCTADANTTYTGGTGITLTGTVFSTTDSEIIHDNLSGFVANEHLDWTLDLGATNIHSGNYTDTNTTYLGGTNLTLDGTTFNVDDAFLKLAGDSSSGNYTLTGAWNFDGGSLEIPQDDTTDATGEIQFDTTDTTLVIYDGTANRIFGDDIYQAIFTIYADSSWDAEAVPIWIAPKDMAVTIVQVSSACMGTTPILTYNIEERAKGSLASAGTDIYATDQTSDANGEDETSFSNAGIAAGAHLVLTTGTSVESGTVDLITGVIYYRKNVE